MKFSKYNGLGNDFIILDYEEGIDYGLVAMKLCPNHIGIGADGLIVVKENPLEMIFYNADGSRAPMCGNGIRCFARYCYKKGIAKEDMVVLTQAGKMMIKIIGDEVLVNMGYPIEDNNLLGINEKEYKMKRHLSWRDKDIIVYSVFMGTIHSVILTDNINDNECGYDICHNELFTKQTNVNFVHVLDRKNIEMITYERGVGMTYACGTGACASYVILRKLGMVDEKITVHLKYGDLIIYENDGIYMQGPATHTFNGEEFII